VVDVVLQGEIQDSVRVSCASDVGLLYKTDRQTDGMDGWMDGWIENGR
jgi:hypothetical protein